MKTNLLTIVIPAKNEETLIAKTLQAIEKQSYVTPETPIIIADAGSTDNTLDIIRSFKSRLNVKVVVGGLPSVGRNNGARYATTKYILFLDADIELGEPTALEKAIALAESKNLELVTTYIKTIDGTIIDKLFWKLHGFVSSSKLMGAFGAGMFIMINREAFERIGGFNEKIALGEDWDLTHQIEPSKFSVANTFIYTTNRRFKFQGYFKTIAQYVLVATSPKYRHQQHTEYFDITFQ